VTTIAAWKDKEQVWMAGDSGAFDDSTVIISAEPKLWATDVSLIGVAGSFRIMDILRYSSVGEPSAVRDFLISKSNDPGFPQEDWSVLVADYTGIYEIGEDFSLLKSKENYGATGAGAPTAFGALYALEKVDIEPKKRLEIVVNATIYHTTNARPPIRVIHL